MANPRTRGRPQSNRAREKRELLVQIVREERYVTTRTLLERSRLGWGTLHYHLWALQRQGSVASALVGRRRVYHPPDQPAPDPAWYEPSVPGPLRRVMEAVGERDGQTQSQIQRATGLSQRMCSYYLAKLHRAGRIERRERGSRVEYGTTSRLANAYASLPSATPKPPPGSSAVPASLTASSMAVMAPPNGDRPLQQEKASSRIA